MAPYIPNTQPSLLNCFGHRVCVIYKGACVLSYSYNEHHRNRLWSSSGPSPFLSVVLWAISPSCLLRPSPPIYRSHTRTHICVEMSFIDRQDSTRQINNAIPPLYFSPYIQELSRAELSREQARDTNQPYGYFPRSCRLCHGDLSVICCILCIYVCHFVHWVYSYFILRFRELLANKFKATRPSFFYPRRQWLYGKEICVVA